MAYADSRALGEMNTTPLIDVLLVLLVMFVITIPAATHSVDIDLPGKPPIDLPRPDVLKNKVVIDDTDRLLWNAEPISESQLVELLALTRQLEIEPELQFEPAPGASYAQSARTLQLIKQSGVTKFGFVGNERYRDFTRDR